MNNRFFNYLLALVFLNCFFLKANAQNVQAEAKLQQYTIRIGDQTKLFLSVHQPAKEHVDFPKLTDTLTGKVQVISTNKPDTLFDQNDHNLATVTQSYTITCFDAGTYTIPGFAIITKTGVLKTNGLTLQVQTVKVDTTKAIYDIKQPLAVSYSFFDWLRDNWTWVVISAIGVLAIIGLIWYLLKRPKPTPVVVQPIIPRLAEHIIAINKLNELRDKKLWQQGEVKQYYIELSDIVREYLENRYFVQTHEQTTDEIITALRHKNITAQNRKKMTSILQLADLVKFAKVQPLPVDNEQSMDDAFNFVLNTQHTDEPVLNTEGGDTNGIA